MKKINFLFAFLLIATMSMAQNSPIDFESGGYGSNWTWNVFENSTNPALDIVANPSKTGINTSDTVAKFTALKAGQPWAGCESAHGTAYLGKFVLDTNNSTIKIKVYKSVISDVGIKLVSDSSWALPEIKVANTVINQWEELTFDFSNYTNPPAANGVYDQIVIFPDFDLAGRGQDNICYFDDITFNKAISASSGPTVAAPTPPALDASKVISVFSNAFTNVTGTDFNPAWGQSTIVTTPKIQNDDVLKYANLNYQGTTFGSAIDASSMEFLHVDMWTADATTVNIFCISTGPVEKSYSLGITANQWVSYDIPLAAFTGVDMTDLIQFKFDGGTGKETIYLDNIYFYIAPPSGPTTAAPTPTIAASNVISIYSNAYTNVAGTDFNPAWGQSTVVSYPVIAGDTTLKYSNFNYQGTTFGSAVDASSMEYLHVDMWTADATTVNIFSISTGPVEKSYSLGITANQWVSYDIPLTEFTGVDMTDLIQFKFDGGTGKETIYLDNIYFYIAPPSGPTTAAPTPTTAASNVISIYSNAYTNEAGTDFNPAWGQSTIVSNPVIQSDDVMKYANFNYQGITFGSAIDASNMEYLHLDMWTADASAVNIFCISTGPVEKSYSLGITANKWVSYNIPISEFSGVDMTDLIQLKFDGGTGTESIYLDNIYFYFETNSIKNSLSNNDNNLSVYPNPVASGETVVLGADVKLYQVFDIIGNKILNGTSTEFSTENLVEGTYLIVVENNKGSIQTQKLIVK